MAAFNHRAVVEVDPGPRLQCASLLKPLYAWAAAERARVEDLRRAVITSDNVAADAVVAAVGGLPAVLGRLATLTGVAWSSADTWGRVPVTATEVATAYAALARSPDPGALAVVDAMRRVSRPQRMGLAAQWGMLRDTAEPEVAVKCGWDLGADGLLRTHVVVCSGGAGAAVLTGVLHTPEQRRRWDGLLVNGPNRVLPWHSEVAGAALREGLRRADHALCLADGS